MYGRDRTECGLQMRYSWKQVQEYWRAHDNYRGRIDTENDPDGLANVCYPNAPRWYNQRCAEWQGRVFKELILTVPSSSRGLKSALDVGCGAARWSRRLTRQGYRVTGIDLQRDLIKQNRRRFPNIEFVSTSLQDFECSHSFDLVTSVTVLQHMPYEEQERCVRRLGDLVRAGGAVLMIENCRDEAPHVWSRRPRGWMELFETYGFTARQVMGFDFRPLSHAVEETVRRLFVRKRSVRTPNVHARAPRRSHGLISGIYYGTLNWLGALDALLESGRFARQGDISKAWHMGAVFELPES